VVEEMPRKAKHRLVEEVKRLVDRVSLLDPERLDAAVLDDLTRQVAATADAATGLPAHEALAASDEPLEERSPFSGRSNPLAAPMTITRDGELTRAVAVYTAAYEGPQDTLHGGFVAAAFDDLLGVAQTASGSAGFTGTLTVKMRRPTPLFTPVTYEGGVDHVRGRKIVCTGRSWADGVLVSEAECLFVTPKDRPVR
jgi:acyl-coenzyme A thioesterase PaaI-like protein